MTIAVTVKPSAKHEVFEKLEDGTYVVAVKEPPREGRANAAVMRAVAAYFEVPSASIRILSGFTTRKKIIEVIT